MSNFMDDHFIVIPIGFDKPILPATTEHEPLCDDNGWDHPGACVIESEVCDECKAGTADPEATFHEPSCSLHPDNLVTP
jgi:hypothetical protein